MSFAMKPRFLKARYKCWNKALTLLLEQSPAFKPQSPNGFLPENGLEVGEDRLMETDRPRATGSIIKV